MTASEIRALFSVASRPEVVSLAGGSPYVSALPMDAVAETLADLVARRGAVALQYATAQGDELLREQVCEVMAPEGIDGHPDDVVMTTGSQQALDLVTRIFVDPGDVVLAEAPSYVGALQVFRSYQADVVHVPMDDKGLEPVALEEAIQHLRAQGRQLAFLYTIPSFHNPAGTSQPESRREEVLEVCRRHDVLVIEDDPYGLLGFDGDPYRALRADDPEGVIYLGSFSKTFAPGLRVGWALAPHAVREKLVLASEATQLCPSSFSQLAVSSYLSTQDWRGQVDVYRDLYRQRRDATLEALTATMPEGTTWTHPLGGFYVWVTLPEGFDTRVMLPRAVTARVAFVPGSAFFADGSGARSMRLSYCLPEPARIREGVRRLAGVIEEELSMRELFGPAPSHGAAHDGDAPAPDLA
ncbi:PLP-dependent aminotransferase family protein [Vallicoccus soli]|uniref:PLP-dependent aminotransferase family protein n=2 Tax=Vallicoccus soli TaxID=2339232 RepID=A0A3A3YVS9_9ACTN|nr:PLP-dependent aminotransferase family protein [Vallicoccus soli]